eukprot:1931110-Karenia_brevis.AAC.1
MVRIPCSSNFYEDIGHAAEVKNTIDASTRWLADIAGHHLAASNTAASTFVCSLQVLLQTQLDNHRHACAEVPPDTDHHCEVDQHDEGYDIERTSTCAPLSVDAASQHFMTQLTEMQAHTVVTCEDKDPNILWVQYGPAMMLRWVSLLESSGRWQFISWSSLDVVKFYQSKLYSFGPSFLKDGKWRFEEKQIPIAYPTVKKKCFAAKVKFMDIDGITIPCTGAKTCEKHLHSCYRNVISFCKFPFPRMFKRMTRALMNICYSLLISWCVPDLAKSPQCLMDRCDMLKHNDSRCCLFCGCKMKTPTLQTYDVPQAYEEVHVDVLKKDVSYLMRVAEKTNTGMQQVLHSIKSIVGPCKKLQRNMGDRTVIVSRTLEKCVSLYLDCRIFKVGNTFIYQKQGIPIGGYMSSGLLNIYLTVCEDRFAKKGWKQHLGTKKCDQNLLLQELVAISRYEDDIVAMSYLLCPSCVNEIVQHAYRSRIRVD